MLPFKRNSLHHALSVSPWLRQHGASACIDPATQVMNISLDGTRGRLRPQLSRVASDGLPALSPEPKSGVRGFVGWLPYLNKRRPDAQGNLAFKVFARARGVQTPAWSGLNGPGVGGPLLVKPQQSTLGRGMLEPFCTAATLHSAWAITSRPSSPGLSAIPPEMQGGSTMFTLGGVEDAAFRLAFLESICNPQLYPACYPWMLKAIFERTH